MDLGKKQKILTYLFHLMFNNMLSLDKQKRKKMRIDPTETIKKVDDIGETFNSNPEIGK